MTLKRGFQVAANVEVDSPQQGNSQAVNVTVHNNLAASGRSGQISASGSLSGYPSVTAIDPNVLTRDVPIVLPSTTTVDGGVDGGVEGVDDTPAYVKTPYPTNVRQVSDATLNVPSQFSGVFQQPLSDKSDTVVTNANTVVTNASTVVTNANNRVVQDLLAICKDKDSLITALSLIVDIYQHNPVLINKYIVASENMLIDLLHCLTNADEIQMTKQDVVTGSCLCKASDCNYAVISKIMIIKGGQTFNFKYSFPNVIQFLEDRNISWKMCC